MERLKLTNIFAQKQDNAGSVAIYLGQELNSGAMMMVATEMREVDPRGIADPSMVLDMRSAQHLIDALWDAGLRPTEGSGSAGALAATERHLKDMQTITFKLLNQEKP